MKNPLQGKHLPKPASRVFWAFLVPILAVTSAFSAQAAERVTYYYTDQQGTPLATVDATTGTVVAADFRPFGTQALGAAHDGPGYTGHVGDVDSGLVYMQARYYDPYIGHFLSVDPLGPAPGNPSNFSRYVYAGNNPIINVDPDGRKYAEMYAVYGAGTGFVVTAGASVAVDAFSGGLNVAATPLELTAGTTAGGYIGYKVGAFADWVTGNSSTTQDSRSKAPAPLPEAEGNPHSIPDGKGGYITYDEGGAKQYRPTGKSHGNIPRPNVKEWKPNVTPDGKVYPGKGQVRPPQPHEVPQTPPPQSPPPPKPVESP